MATRQSIKTRSLDEFKRQFYQWYYIDNYSLSKVTILFNWLFCMLSSTTGKSYSAEEEQWCYRRRFWNKTWHIRRNEIPETQPEEFSDQKLWFKRDGNRLLLLEQDLLPVYASYDRPYFITQVEADISLVQQGAYIPPLILNSGSKSDSYTRNPLTLLQSRLPTVDYPPTDARISYNSRSAAQDIGRYRSQSSNPAPLSRASSGRSLPSCYLSDMTAQLDSNVEEARTITQLKDHMTQLPATQRLLPESPYLARSASNFPNSPRDLSCTTTRQSANVAESHYARHTLPNTAPNTWATSQSPTGLLPRVPVPYGGAAPYAGQAIQQEPQSTLWNMPPTMTLPSQGVAGLSSELSSLPTRLSHASEDHGKLGLPYTAASTNNHSIGSRPGRTNQYPSFLQ